MEDKIKILEENYRYIRDKLDKIDEKLDLTDKKVDKLTNGTLEAKIRDSIEKHLSDCPVQKAKTFWKDKWIGLFFAILSAVVIAVFLVVLKLK